jgi:shikimate 5-dehydrogenase
MLIWQAEASFNIWTGKDFTSALVNQLFKRMQ